MPPFVYRCPKTGLNVQGWVADDPTEGRRRDLSTDHLHDLPVSEPERISFVELLAALVRTGRIWVVATLRADFYARMLDQPALRMLKELGATYDLGSPGLVELAETVRAPAEAAGLIFETDAACRFLIAGRQFSCEFDFPVPSNLRL